MVAPIVARLLPALARGAARLAPVVVRGVSRAAKVVSRASKTTLGRIGLGTATVATAGPPLARHLGQQFVDTTDALGDAAAQAADELAEDLEQTAKNLLKSPVTLAAIGVGLALLLRD